MKSHGSADPWTKSKHWAHSLLHPNHFHTSTETLATERGPEIHHSLLEPPWQCPSHSHMRSVPKASQGSGNKQTKMAGWKFRMDKIHETKFAIKKSLNHLPRHRGTAELLEISNVFCMSTFAPALVHNQPLRRRHVFPFCFRDQAFQISDSCQLHITVLSVHNLHLFQ